MKQLIEFPLESGETVLVEVDYPEGQGMIPATRGKIVQRAQQTFEAALSKTILAAQTLLNKLKDLQDNPDEVVVEFGVKMHAEADAAIAATGAEANIRVTLAWKRKGQ